MRTGRRRLSGKRAFAGVFREGSRLNGRLCTIVVKARAGGSSARLGLSVSRRIGKAVARNRAKRLIREAFRRSAWATTSAGLDVVVIARDGLLEAGFADLGGELDERWRRWITKRRQGRSRGAPPSRGV